MPATSPRTASFRSGYAFDFDEFQVLACQALEQDSSVLVCAPTGSGKTVVGEFAVHLALVQGLKCFYTTPIKALSNQKYNDLVSLHGAANVGLLTGDSVVNANAPIIVMTTEVLRNMLYVGSQALVGLGYVVMDEVHYLGDRYRGAVWEEVIIHLPESVLLVSLSATVSNAEEFGEWLQSVRGTTEVIVHEKRPIPLWQHMLVESRLFDLFSAESIEGGEEKLALNPHLRRYVEQRSRPQPSSSFGRRHGSAPVRWRPTRRPDVVAVLDHEGLLPTIDFIFSRAGCDAAVRQCIDADLWLTTEPEREEITELVTRRVSSLPADDLNVLGYWEWLDGLRRGLAAHHAGLIPAFKETVEELFTCGLVRMVFATETLGLGINMPARSVVLERLTKFNGEAHVDITPGEYTQFTGRAGRRGIDIEGHAIVLWAPDIDPNRVAGLASRRTFPLRSSFRPSYNMAVNLVSQMGRSAAKELLESSFAQFQADRSVATVASQIRRNQSSITKLQSGTQCHLGDFAEYDALRRKLSDLEKAAVRTRSRSRRASVVASLEHLRPGDVIRIPSGRRSGFAVVIDPGTHARDEPRPLVVTDARWGGRVTEADFPASVDVLATVRLPRSFNHRSPQERRDLASTLHNVITSQGLNGRTEPSRRRSTETDLSFEAEIGELRATIRQHPCHGCADREEHARTYDQAAKLARETATLTKKVDGRTNSLGRAFAAICGLLSDRGYLVGDEVTADGLRLARIWSESDLLVSESLRQGLWDELDPAELAAVVSSLVYEPRRDEQTLDRFPTQAVEHALRRTERLWTELTDAESARGLTPAREPEFGFVWASYRWARHDSLERALAAAAQSGAPMPGGDFVRWCKQLLDLLEQIATVGTADDRAPAGTTVASRARSAAKTIRRGVVAQGMAT